MPRFSRRIKLKRWRTAKRRHRWKRTDDGFYGLLALPEVDDEVLAVLGAGLLDEVVHVGLDGPHGEHELVGDLLVGLLHDDEAQDLGLALGQPVLHPARRP